MVPKEFKRNKKFFVVCVRVMVVSGSGTELDTREEAGLRLYIKTDTANGRRREGAEGAQSRL